jgi:two-component system, sensor histidine kinase and response regulator
MAGDREKALQAGMDDYVSKPIRFDDLRRAIERQAPEGLQMNVLLEGLGGDRKLLGELVALFLADAPKLLTRVERAIAKGDAVRLKEAAHALKGSVGNFDPGTAFEAVRKLEMLGREKKLDEARPAFVVAKAEVTRLMRALKKMGS